jgi:hypothetical protein
VTLPVPAEPHHEPRIARLATLLIWAGGGLVVAAAAIVSVAGLVVEARSAAAADRVPIIAGTLGLVGVAIVVLAAIWSLASMRPRAGVIAAFGVLIAVRIAAMYAWDAPLVSDWLHYHNLALGAMRGAPPVADVPMGFPMALGLAYSIGGVSIAAGEALNLAASIVTGVLIAAVVRWSAGMRAAALAVALFAIAPSQVFFGLLLGSETLFATATVAIALLATAVVIALDRRRWTAAIALGVACGIALGLATYVRATALAFTPLVALIPLLGVREWRRAVPPAVAIVLAAVVTLGPVIAWNRSLLGTWSPSTSLYTGWQLYVGANVATVGAYNAEDAARVDALVPGYQSRLIGREYAAGIFNPSTYRLHAARDAVALRLAATRFKSDGLRFVAVLPLKFGRGWGRADDPVFWVLDRGTGQTPVAGSVMHLAAQLWWLCVTLIVAAWYVLERRRRPLLGLVTAVVVIAIAVSIELLESQSRYHEPVVPLFAAIAGVALSGRVGDFVAPRPARLRRGRSTDATER